MEVREMLEIIIPEQHHEEFDESTNTFLPSVDIKETKIQLEHSLISLKKWEQKWHKPFFGTSEKLPEEMMDYIRCMTVSSNVNPAVYRYLTNDMVQEIVKYIEDPMTATWFNDDKTKGAQKSSREVITAEIIYYWMIALQIPMECQKWHLNTLLTLIKVVSIKNSKQEKMDPKIAAKQRQALNKARRARHGSRG